ncbi:ROK family protein [Neptunomonas marina]|uniref:ROK family protein n=1 Tax=Neptunomonas marina TaxID=1815562 RepID=A0A437Q7G6_9GAMM|nr:ROK family protein [Neptunomonas marina]RVU30439.1 ROK family protein [Neptunomonas marina]
MHIGIDLGGTKIELIALDNSGVELLRQRVATPQGDYLGTVDTIVTLVTHAEQRLGATGTVGIGIPGTISRDSGIVKNANSTCLIGQPLQQDIEHRLKREVRFANDADCFTLSEATDGAGQNADIVFGVILGTGVGGGITVCKQLLEGANQITGEWGHNPLPWPQQADLPSPPCYCGRSGCIETYLSGPGFSKLIGGELNLEKYWQQHHESEACDHYLDRLARSLASVINILDPHTIVLGGGLSNIERLYSEVPKRWGKYIFSDRVHTQIKRAVHGDSSGVRGAAWLWPLRSGN